MLIYLSVNVFVLIKYVDIIFFTKNMNVLKWGQFGITLFEVVEGCPHLWTLCYYGYNIFNYAIFFQLLLFPTVSFYFRIQWVLNSFYQNES